MEISQQGKHAVKLVTQKRLELIELRLKDLEREIMGLKEFIDQLPEDREPTVQEPQHIERVQREPVERPKSQTLLNLEKTFPEIKSGALQSEIQQPKLMKPEVEPDIQLDGVELRFLKMISGQEENEHELPIIAGQMNLTIARVQDVITKLFAKGLLYSPNPNDLNAEFYIDQKGLEALAKKKLL